MVDSHALPRAALLDLCRTLVQTPSVNGHDPERAVAEQVAAFAHQHGLAVELLAQTAERPNVLVRVGPAGPATLLLLAHTDTVPTGQAATWTYPPFAAQLHDGRLYGRGAIDNKGGIVAGLAALLLLQQAAPHQPVLLACVPDEESGATGTLGVRYLHSLGKLAARAAIYTYPGMRELVIGHRGMLRVSIMTHGVAYHSGSRAWQEAAPSANAVTGMAEILLELEREQLDQFGSGLFTPFRTMITPTLIDGGSGPSIVPDTCTALLDIRLVPETPGAEVERVIRKVLAAVMARRPVLRAELRVDTALPPTQIAADAPIVTALQTAAQHVLGWVPPLTVSGPANESYILNELGIPTCVFGPTGDNAHAADEFVVLESIFQVATVYAHAARLLAQSAD
jgi:succinyl-diaminopimelate desuccinylase